MMGSKKEGDANGLGILYLFLFATGSALFYSLWIRDWYLLFETFKYTGIILLLWFLYMIIQLALFGPLFQFLTKDKSAPPKVSTESDSSVT